MHQTQISHMVTADKIIDKIRNITSKEINLGRINNIKAIKQIIEAIRDHKDGVIKTIKKIF